MTGFPGLRLPMVKRRGLNRSDSIYLQVIGRKLAPLVRRIYGIDLIETVSSAWSVMCSGPGMRYYGNRCPHADFADLAAVHYLAGSDSIAGAADGALGTAFYMNRALGSMTVPTRRGDGGHLTGHDGRSVRQWDFGRECAPSATGALQNCSEWHCVNPEGHAEGSGLSSTNELYERKLVVAPRRNRLLLYPGAMWHSAHIEAQHQ